jgi:Domain of unknown function (DUF222)/HNH endonuclease
MPNTTTEVAPISAAADLASVVGQLSKDDLRARMHEAFRVKTAAEAEFTICLAESNKREMFRDDGATSLEAWTAETLGVSSATARSYAHVAEKSQALPQLMGALSGGEISLDKVRAVLDVATPGTDQALCAQAKELNVRELTEVARTSAARARSATVSPSRSEHEGRYVRFNDERRTMTAQLPSEDYARTKARVDACADTVSSEEKTPLDQRRCDGFMGIIDSVTPGAGNRAASSDSPTTGTTSTTSTTTATTAAPKPFFVVAHVPLESLVDGSGDKSELAAELEHQGLIDVETVQRIACDATVVVAVDDTLGHTMYEGRARRFPTGAQRREVMRRDRQCRFPGCANAMFAAVHHIKPWGSGGRTDLENLVLLCEKHHGVVHRNGWSMTGNANEELRIENPKARVTVSRPSVLWTRVTAAPNRPGPGPGSSLGSGPGPTEAS